MQFAVVDIETTGGWPNEHGITEIAIVLHDGKKVERVYEQLVNPQQPIPIYIQGMTGITDAMVSKAPVFSAVAAEVYDLLKDRVFVAHNVNFDYSFVKHQLKMAGFDLQSPKLCTIRLARKVFPGLHKYGLGSLTRELDITISNRHRAGGDALATAQVLEKVMAKDGMNTIQEMFLRENKEQLLPPNLPATQVKNLPYEPGVYYFHDAKGKVIYVGKAKNIKFRVTNHFTGLNTGRKRQEFLRNIYSISYQTCPTEFSASIFESVEIKRLWPRYNKSQKNYEQLWGIYAFEDQLGYQRLAIDKKRKYTQPIQTFANRTDAHRALWKLVREHTLHAGLCFLDKTTQTPLPPVKAHNALVESAIASFQENNSTFIISETDFDCILIEDGKFYGIGSVAQSVHGLSLEELKAQIQQFPENEVIRSMVRKYVEKFPARVLPVRA